MRDIEKDLVKLIEPQIVSILLARGLVTFKSYNEPLRFSNMRITPSGKAAITGSKPTVTDEFVEMYRNLFPPGRKGPGAEAVKKRLQKFIQNHDCKRDDIIKAAERYISEITNNTYCMSAHYFLYKRVDNIETSKAEEYLEVIQDEKNVTPDFRDQFD